MGEHHGLVRIDAGGHVVEHQVQHVVLDVLGGVAVGDHLVVGDDDVRVDAALLHGDTLTDRAEVVAEVQPAGRAVAGQHGEGRRLGLQLGECFVRTLFGREEARAHLIACRCQLLLVGHAKIL